MTRRATGECGRCKTFEKLVIDSICVLGCLYQVWIVTRTYLAFDVATKVYIYLPETMNSPAISVCSNYSDLVHLPLARRKYRLESRARHPLTWAQRATLQSQVTVGDVFRLTPKSLVPSAGHLLAQCRVRSPSNYTISLMRNGQCNELFAVERFLLQESLCYMFRLRESVVEEKERVHNVNRLSQSLSHNGLFYKLYLSAGKWFLYWTSRMRIVAHTPKTLPFMSYSLSPLILREANTRFQLNKVIVTFSLVQIHLLPPPYVTNCDIGNMKNKCLNKCIHSLTLARLAKVPFSVVIRESDITSGLIDGKHRIVGEREMADGATNSIIQNITFVCNSRCSRSNCYLDYTLTQPIKFKSLKRRFIVLEVGSISQPFVKIDTLPSFELNDYLLMIFSLCGFWLGLGVKDTLILVSRGAMRTSRNILFGAAGYNNSDNRNNRSFVQLKRNNTCTLFCLESRCLALRMIKVHTDTLKSNWRQKEGGREGKNKA